MQFKTTIISGVLCMLMLVGCKDDKPKYGAPMSVKVLGVTGSANLDANLKLGMFVAEPVEADNVPLTVSEGGKAILEKEVKWGFDQSSSSRFLLYAPYSSSYTGQESVSVSFPTDQSTTEKFQNGNLLVGISSGGPKDPSVSVRMKHSMTAMIVTFDNRTGEKITSMTVKGFKTTGKLNLITGSLTAIGNNNRITPLRSPSDPDSFCFLYVPQETTPQFDVTLESGKSISFTFDNYCHEHPGEIIEMTYIKIDETMLPESQNQKILPLDGVNVRQWQENGIPVFEKEEKYLSLSELYKVQPDEKDNNFFYAFINKVTVTAVDRTNPDWLGLILEDATDAIHVWAYYGSKLKVGNTIVGEVLGYMDKPSSREVNISYFYTDYATIGTTDSLPCTEVKVSTIMKEINKYDYHRVLLKDVVLKENFDGDRAIFVQDDTVEFSVVCPGIESDMTENVRGDLIGFPVQSGADFMIMVYDEDQFDSFRKEFAESGLSGRSSYGFYDISATDTVYWFAGREKGLQYAVRREMYGRGMQVTHYASGESHFMFIYDCPGTPVEGHVYSVRSSTFNSTYSGFEMDMECIKVDEKSAWLMDTEGTKGLIIKL